MAPAPLNDTAAGGNFPDVFTSAEARFHLLGSVLFDWLFSASDCSGNYICPVERRRKEPEEKKNRLQLSPIRCLPFVLRFVLSVAVSPSQSQVSRQAQANTNAS